MEPPQDERSKPAADALQEGAPGVRVVYLHRQSRELLDAIEELIGASEFCFASRDDLADAIEGRRGHRPADRTIGRHLAILRRERLIVSSGQPGKPIMIRLTSPARDGVEFVIRDAPERDGRDVIRATNGSGHTPAAATLAGGHQAATTDPLYVVHQSSATVAAAAAAAPPDVAAAGTPATPEHVAIARRLARLGIEPAAELVDAIASSAPAVRDGWERADVSGPAGRVPGFWERVVRRAAADEEPPPPSYAWACLASVASTWAAVGTANDDTPAALPAVTIRPFAGAQIEPARHALIAVARTAVNATARAIARRLR